MMINHTTNSELIKKWQLFLVSQGIIVSHIDGLWGQETKNGTKQFQKNNNLDDDGIVGGQTLAIAQGRGFVTPSVQEHFQDKSNSVIDISHHNVSIDFEKIIQSGIAAVFHKGTQSLGNNLFRDRDYPTRKTNALKAGLLWGAYHFGTKGDGKVQANEFLDYIKPDNDTLMVLDFERCTTVGEDTMSIDEAKDFVSQIKYKTGKYPGIYGGALLRESLHVNSDPILSQCWLWIAQYGSLPHLPNGWENYTFWQYTDGESGIDSIPVDGVGKCDREIFNGTAEELVNFWNKHRT